MLSIKVALLSSTQAIYNIIDAGSPRVMFSKNDPIRFESWNLTIWIRPLIPRVLI